jgi:hypothetical protein
MNRLGCWLLFAPVTVALVAAPARVARVGELEGKVEVQIHAADVWRPAVRNMPLVERAWIRTANTASVEMELDDGSALRLASDALCEFSDYTRLSTGQRVSVLSIDHGVAYFTGQPERRDAVILVVPGAQATVHTGTRLRLEARDNASQISVLEGKIRFSSPVAEMDLSEGETARVENASRARFFLYREIVPLDGDRWNEQRDKALAATGSGGHVPGVRYGLADLDAGGSWMQTADLGVVWKPKVTAGWTPYRDGQWLWYDELGYTWIANESWGRLPFHYGRWMDSSGLGWVWSPGKPAAFKPGEVYWLREANLVGWGPLGPGETWAAASVPRLYLRRNTTLARWAQDARVLNPVDAAEKLTTSGAVFVIAPPSPAFDSARFDAVRPELRAGSTRIVPMVPGVTYAGSEPAPEMASTPPVPPEPPVPEAPPDPTISSSPGPLPPQPVPEPPDVYYPAAIYTGIVVINPPEQGDEHHGRRDSGSTKKPAAPGLGMPRGESDREHRDTTPVHRAETPARPTAQPPASPPQPARASAPPKTIEPPPALGMPRGEIARERREALHQEALHQDDAPQPVHAPRPQAAAPPPQAAAPPPSKASDPPPAKGSDGSDKGSRKQ